MVEYAPHARYSMQGVHGTVCTGMITRGRPYVHPGLPDTYMHMQQLSDIRMESFMDFFLGFETTLKRIEKLVCIQKEQCDEIKDRVEMIEKSQAIFREQADFIKGQVATVTVRAASREQVDHRSRHA